MRNVSIAVLLAAIFALPLLAQTDEVKTVKSADGSLALTIPADWTDQKLNDAAEVQVGSDEQSAYLLILVEKKADLFGWNIERHSYVTLGTLLSNVSLPKINGPKAMKINGNPAIQYEVRGASAGSNIVYLHTTIETPDVFAQVLAWTVPSQELKARAALEKAIQSVRTTK